MNRRAESVAGVTLVELMVVVSILAILTAIAYPSYQSAVVKGRRSDAYVSLLNSAQRLEQCFTEFGSYTDANCPISGTFDSPEGFYSVTVVSAASTFALTAAPQGAQTRDPCGALTYDNLGRKGALGAEAPVNCWD